MKDVLDAVLFATLFCVTFAYLLYLEAGARVVGYPEHLRTWRRR